MTDSQKDYRKLCIFNVKESDSDDTVREMCEKLGRLVCFNRPNNKRLAFPLFHTEGDARNAKDALVADGYKVDFANTKRDDGNDDAHRLPQNNEFRTKASPTVAKENDDIVYEEDDESESPYGSCLKCSDKARFNCGRCRDFYCSQECQESDWLSHKRACFQMPKLVPSKSIQNLFASRTNLRMVSPKAVRKSIDSPDGRPKAEDQQQRTKFASPIVTNGVKAATLEEKDEPVKTPPKAVTSPRERFLAMASAQPKVEPSSAKPVEDFIRNDSEVIITHVVNHASVYIYSVAASAEYEELITKVHQAAKTAPKLSSYPERHDLVIAPFDDVYYRAMVVSCNKDAETVKVGYIDFGNLGEVPFVSLRALSQDLKDHRRLTHKVGLTGIPSEVNEAEATKLKSHLAELYSTQSVLKVKADHAEIRGRDNVELINVISNQSVNETLKGMLKKHYTLEDLKQIEINASDSLVVPLGLELLNDGFLMCISDANINDFMVCDEIIQNYGNKVKNAPAYEPKEKELCVVKVTENEEVCWYRGQYQQALVDDLAQIKCIDYGKICNVQVNNIRAFSDEVAYDIISFRCNLQNEEKSSKEFKKWVQKNPKIVAKTISFDGRNHHALLDYHA